MDFTHIDESGRSKMVDVSGKNITARFAKASGKVYVSENTFKLIKENKIIKGNVIETARIAGIMAAKKTSELIPMCHPLNIENLTINITLDEVNLSVYIEASATITGKTGVEMEALTAVSVAALTVYDMCKSSDKNMVIGDIMLLEKTGGKSGQFSRDK
jgi:cyclic pyranopterin phosphate synthase